MIQTPIIDSAISPTRDLKGTGPYNNVPNQKSHAASTNLSDHLENQKNTQILSIVDMFIGDEGAQDIANFLSQNKEYTSIHLRGNNISAVGFEAICNSLSGSKKLKEIAAEWNNIGSEPFGVAALHKLVQTSPSLEILDLKNNRLNPACAFSIADIIRHSNSLKKIDLRWNELGAEGGQQILTALQDSGRRVQLELSGNRIPEQILVQIGQSSQGRSSPSARSTVVAEQGAKRMFQSQISQPTYTSNATAAMTSHAITSQTQAFGGTIPSKYTNTNEVNNMNTLGSTQRKVYEPPQERNNLYSSAIQVSSQRLDPGLRVETGASLKTTNVSNVAHNLVQDPGQRVDTFGSLSQLNYPQPPEKYTYAHEQVHVPSNAYISPYRPQELVPHDSRPVYEVVRAPPVRTVISQPVIDERVSLQRPPTQVFTPIHAVHTPVHTMYPPVHSIQTVHTPMHAMHMIPETVAPMTEYRHEPIIKSAPVVHEQVPVQRSTDDGNLKVGKLISDLERAAETEKDKALDLKVRLDAALRDLENESKGRQDAEKKHSHILDELRRRDLEVNELRVKVDTLTEENAKILHQISVVEEENARIDEYNKAGMAEIEQRYRVDLENAQAENQVLKRQVETIQQNLNGQIVHMRDDFENRCRHYDEQISEFARLNDELSSELSGQLDFIERIKVEHEEQMRRTILEIREEGIRKAEPVIRALEDEVKVLQDNNQQLTMKNTEMLHDLQAYEKQIRDLHMQFATELNRVGADMDRARADLNHANMNIQRLTNELTVRNNAIVSLEGENDKLRQELQIQANEHNCHMENLRRDLEAERRRLAEQERHIHLKVQELERRLQESQNETVRIKVEYDQLVQMIQGNVSKVIHDTVLTHHKASEVRHLDQSRIIAPVRPVVETTTPVRTIFDDKPVLAQSRIFTTSDKRYL